MKKKEHKSKSLFWRLSLVLSALILSTNMMAQSITQTGVIVDQNNEPMIGVTVQVKGATTGGITDLDGNFSIKCNKGATLVFSFMGYKTVEHKASGQRMRIEMVEDAQALDEVVIVGFGSMNKKHITGSMTSVDSKILEEKNSVNVFDALQGAAPGMQIVSNSGAPGSSSFVSIRGASTFSDEGVSPLYVVDGVVVDNIDDISANDIKQIDVMKDAASSAIYGARSANGVILITTKSGESGKPRVDVRYQHSFYTVARKLPQVNAFESRLSMAASDLDNPSKTLEKFSARTDSVGMKYSTNYYYQDLLFRTGGRDDASVQISGGSKGFKYRASLNYIGEKGVILESGNDKYTANINVDYEPWKNIKFTTRVRLSYNKVNNIKESVLQDAMRRDPDMIIWYPDGELIPYYSSGGRRNPIAELKQKLDERSTYRGNFYQGVTWTFTPWLRLDADISADYTSYRNLTFSSKYLEGSDNGKNTGADRSQQTWKYAGEAYLNFNKTIAKDHSLNAMVGSSFEVSNQLEYNIAGSFFLSEDIHYMNLATVKDVKNIYTSGWDEAMVGVFGRVVYSWKSRYTITGNLRFDGSSRFGKNNRWGSFPSVSAAWRISDESFMEWSKDWLSTLKMRASYGKSGNARVGSYWRQTYSPVTSTKNLYYQNEIGQSSLQPAKRLRNENLTWESKFSTNVGFDLGFFSNRINLTFDYYNDVTKDLIMEVQLPSNAGYSSQYQNLGQTTNRGVELSLNANLVQTKDFYLDFNFNIAFNKNKVDALYGANGDEMILSGGGTETGSDNYRVFVGQEVGLMYGYVSDGMYSFDDFTFNPTTKKWDIVTTKDENGVPIVTDCSGVLSRAGGYFGPGHMKLKDLNGDGVIDADNDRKVIGHALPKHTGGFSFNAGWKGFDVTAMFNWSYGNDILNINKVDYTSYTGSKRYQNLSNDMRLANRFTTIDPVTGLNIYYGEYANPERLQEINSNASIWHPLMNNTITTDWLVEDGSFLRLGVLTLGYTLPKYWTQKFGVKSLRVYATGNNLFCLTGYSGQDPEVNTSSSNMTPGYDRSAYPKSRSYIFGLNVTF